ncbi:MAG: AAA-like domain-containing protein [Xenococcaceae cyanobacterium]
MLAYNYYKVGGSLEYQHPTYIKRQADDELYEGLKNGDFCYVLNSRQMGKSSLRVQMMKRLQAEGISCVSIDITTIGSYALTPENWYGGIAFELLSGFNLLGEVNFNSWWSEHKLLPPAQRLNQLIKEVLLAELCQNLVIFIDEIDSILKIDFKDDFFAFIRSCYNQRVDNAEYNRLTFCLLGVATPSDLIQDKKRTPFNIGRAIELTGFTLEEAKLSLTEGLAQKVDNPERILEEVLAWTEGQPFLTQKLCQLVVQKAQSRNPNIEQLVQTQAIENWEGQDEPEHLRTIRDRLLTNEQRAGKLLGLYQQIWQQGGIAADGSSEQMELRLSGLVVKEQGKLRVYNPIYKAVFDQSWVDKQLASVRPYSQAIAAWLASNRQDESRLLRGQALQEALDWKAGKSLSIEDDDFLAASLQLAMVQMQRDLEAKQQAIQILGEAKQQAEQLLEKAKEGTKLERAGVTALQMFETRGREIEALLTAMQAGQALHKWVQDDRPLQDYPATSPLLALQQILDQIRERNQFKGHRGFVTSVSFSPNGKYIATVSEDGTVRLWNLTGHQIAQFNAHRSFVTSISFSPDGEYIATASSDCSARLWDLFGNQIAEFKGHSGMVLSASFSNNGEYIATASSDCSARLWDLSGNQIAQFNGYQDWVRSASFSPNGEYIATASSDCSARLWDLSGHQIAEFIGHRGKVLSVSFSLNGEYIATASSDCSARLWDLSGRQIAQLNAHRGWVRSISFSPNGKYLGTGSGDGTARLWDLSGHQIAELMKHNGGVRSVSFSPNGKYLATASSDCIARLWDLSGHQITAFKGHKRGLNSVSFSPKGEYLATASSDCSARLWDLSGHQIAEFNRHMGFVTSVSFNPKGKYIATASSSDDTARLWDLSGHQIAQFNGHMGGVWSVSFSSNGELLATASKDGIARLWDLSGHQIAEFKGHQEAVWSVNFSPNGELLATASLDGTARLWDLSGHQIAEFMGHQESVWSVSFSPNGELLATASEDGIARLWDLSGHQIAEFKGHQDTVWSVSFSPNGEYLATASADGTARLWRVEELDELLCRGCDWLKYYLASHPETLEKLVVCQNRNPKDLE